MKIYLLHGKGGLPEGSAKQLQAELAPLLTGAEFVRVKMPHADPEARAEESVEFLRAMNPEQDAVIVGVSLGGLVAAKLQEDGREDLRVVSISAPTWADGVELKRKMAGRVALYSAQDEVIADRVARWPELAEAHDLAWLSHDTDRHKVKLAGLVAEWVGKLT